MDSLGSLALATEEPASDVLSYAPIHRSASLLTPAMTRNILIISGYEMLIILLMMFDGVGDTFCAVPAALVNDQFAKELRIKYRYTVIYNFFIFA